MTGIEAYAAVPAEGNGRPAVLVQRFLLTKRSPHTRFSYGLDLGVRQVRPGTTTAGKPGVSKVPDWLTFCQAAGVDPIDGVIEDHVAIWARGMEAAGLSAATAARKLSAVSSLYDWLVRGGHTAQNPAVRLARPYVNPDVSKTPGLTREQALAMLAAADKPTPQSLRNAALTALLLYTGARVSEATGANLDDLGMDRGHRVVWVTRKGGSRQPLVLPPPALDRIGSYLDSRADPERVPARVGEAGRSRPLIATRSGKRMRDADVWVLMRQLGKAANFPDELVASMGVHSMRHSFATLYLDAGGNLRDLQDAMDHKDPRTTRRYDRARGVLDRSPGYKLAAYLSGEADEGETG